MHSIALSIEKMNRLKELGIDTSDSSLFWVSYKQIEDEITFLCPKELLCQYKNNPILKCKITPAYTLQDILNKLPKRMDVGCLSMDYHEQFTIGYSNMNHGLHYVFFKSADTELEAAYQLLHFLRFEIFQSVINKI